MGTIVAMDQETGLRSWVLGLRVCFRAGDLAGGEPHGTITNSDLPRVSMVDYRVAFLTTETRRDN